MAAPLSLLSHFDRRPVDQFADRASAEPAPPIAAVLSQKVELNRSSVTDSVPGDYSAHRRPDRFPGLHPLLDLVRLGEPLDVGSMAPNQSSPSASLVAAAAAGATSNAGGGELFHQSPGFLAPIAARWRDAAPRNDVRSFQEPALARPAFQAATRTQEDGVRSIEAKAEELVRALVGHVETLLEKMTDALADSLAETVDGKLQQHRLALHRRLTERDRARLFGD